MLDKQRDDYLRIIQHMSELSSGKRKPKDKFQGISNELSEHIGCSGVVMIAFDFIESWKEYTGLKNFPIQHETMPPEEAYFCAKNNHWSGKYGETQKRLCKHIAECFRREIDSAA